MAEIDYYYPFDSIDGDRKTVAATERRFFNALFTDGVIGAGAFDAAETSAGVYSIGAGVAIVGGAIGGIINAKSITAQPAAGATMHIVLRLDTASDARKVSMEAVSSLAAATSAQLDEGGKLDLPLYSVTGNVGGSYTLLDEREYCTSFDNRRFTELFSAMLANMQKSAAAEIAAISQRFEAEVQAASTENAGMYGAAGRQGFINPAFAVNQRGADSYSLSGGTTYTFDRWLARIAGAATSTPVVVSREQDGQRIALVVHNKKYAEGTTAAASCIAQNIEGGVRTFCAGGRKFTVSFDAKASEACALAVEPVQFAKTGGAGASIAAQAVSLTTSWQRFSLTFAGTVTPAVDQMQDVLKIGFFFAWRGNSGRFGADQNAANTVYMANMQINEGDSALPCYVRDYGEELERCRRYYVALGFTSLSCGAQNASTGQVVTSPLPLTRAMRTQPAATFTDRANVVGAASAELEYGAWRNGLTCDMSAGSDDFPVFIVNNTDSSGIVRVCFNSVALNAELMD